MLKEKKSWAQITRKQWEGEIPTPDNSSYVIYNFYRLHDLPLNKYTIEDVYFMLNQNELPDILIPFVLDYLDKKDIYIEAKYYEGDLFNSILTGKCDFWESDKAQKHIPKLKKLIQAYENYDYTNKIFIPFREKHSKNPFIK